MRLTRKEPGYYVTEDGQHAILRTEWDRPRRGVFYLWEIAYRDHNAWTVDSVLGHYTLRDAKRELARRINGG